jgi:hypothetical protein
VITNAGIGTVFRWCGDEWKIVGADLDYGREAVMTRGYDVGANGVFTESMLKSADAQPAPTPPKEAGTP